ncbi:hypothetical protein [Rurimicrobium arvi]|uniref:Uncharacterized protein n=1 Tax=Rurimicrobium arvi TaxID=2049916 RepID=A0ABP8MW03_9BACT
MQTIRLSLLGAGLLLLNACKPGHKDLSSTTISGFIPMDTANVMISSYLSSIDSDTTTGKVPDLSSLIMDANELRSYLNTHSDIQKVKFMFAHRLEYIHAGNEGKPAGYRSDALTLVVAGYDGDNNYVFASDNTVLDHCGPCPRLCPDYGTASSNLLKKED